MRCVLPLMAPILLDYLLLRCSEPRLACALGTGLFNVKPHTCAQSWNWQLIFSGAWGFESKSFLNGNDGVLSKNIAFPREPVGRMRSSDIICGHRERAWNWATIMGQQLLENRKKRKVLDKTKHQSIMKMEYNGTPLSHKLCIGIHLDRSYTRLLSAWEIIVSVGTSCAI